MEQHIVKKFITIIITGKLTGSQQCTTYRVISQLFSSNQKRKCKTKCKTVAPNNGLPLPITQYF